MFFVLVQRTAPLAPETEYIPGFLWLLNKPT